MEAGPQQDLDDAAEAILAAAIAEARRLRHRRCGTEHLLLGATSRSELDEHRTLTLFGLEYPVVELMVEHIGESQRERSAVPDPMPLTERAAAALRTPRADGAGPTGWPEVLHGALLDDRSGACEVVRRLGKDIAWFKMALQQQTRHLTYEQAQAEADQLNAASRAARPPWVGPDPEGLRAELPLPLPTDRHGAIELARHDDTTLRIAGLFAARDGFGFTVLLHGRDWDHEPQFELYDPERGAGQDDRDVVHVSIAFADGSAVDNTYRHPYGYDVNDPPAGRTLAVGSEGTHISGSVRSARAEFWSWPLPPPGPVSIAVTWPAGSLSGKLRLSGDEIRLRATPSAGNSARRFELEATWLPEGFVLQSSGAGGVSMHVVRFSVDGQGVDEAPPPPPTVVFSATWTGQPTVLGEGRLDFPRITVTAVRSTTSLPTPPGDLEHLGGRTVTVHAGDSTHFAGWHEDDLHVQVIGHAVTIDELRTFVAHLRAPG